MDPAAGFYIMPKLRMSGAVTFGPHVSFMACTGATLCVPVPHGNGWVKSEDDVKFANLHTETKLCLCNFLAFCTATLKLTLGVHYCLLELRMAH